MIDVQNADGMTTYRAALRGAVISRDGTSQAETIRNELTINFTQIALTIWPQKADGTLDAPQIGMFDCLKP